MTQVVHYFLNYLVAIMYSPWVGLAKCTDDVKVAMR